MCTAFSDHTPFLLLQQHLNDMAGKWEEGVGRGEGGRAHTPGLLPLSGLLLCPSPRPAGEEAARMCGVAALSGVLHSQASQLPPLFLPPCPLTPPLSLSLSRYIVLRVPSGDTSGATELAKTLVAHLSLLVGDLDPLETTLSMLSHRTVQQTCSGHMTRLSLHVHWTVLCVMFRMIPHLGEGCEGGRGGWRVINSPLSHMLLFCHLQGCPPSCGRLATPWLPSSAMLPPHGTASHSSQYETLSLTLPLSLPPHSLPPHLPVPTAGGSSQSHEGGGDSVAM